MVELQDFRGWRNLPSAGLGKLVGDLIMGTIETERDGQTKKGDWEAKRVKDEK